MTAPRVSMDLLEALLARWKADAHAHMSAGPSDEAELQRIEHQLEMPLPRPYRLFLQRLGGGVYYLQHEIFGPRRVMIHDIELVPDLLSFRQRLGDVVQPQWLPVHRADGRVHVIDLPAGEAGVVRSLDGNEGYPDFLTFLEAISRSR